MRKIVSIVLLIVFLILSITGIQMLMPHAHGLRAGGALFYPKRLHEYASILFMLFGIIHIALNFNVFKAYAKSFFYNKH